MSEPSRISDTGKSEALRLAYALEHHAPMATRDEAAAELRRLHAANLAHEERWAQFTAAHERMSRRIAELEGENEALLAANRDCLEHFNTLKTDYAELIAEVELTKSERDSHAHQNTYLDEKLAELEAVNEEAEGELSIATLAQETQRKRIAELEEAGRMAHEALESLFNWKVDHERGQRCADAIAALSNALRQTETNPPQQGSGE